jgi:hypothetical protein
VTQKEIKAAEVLANRQLAFAKKVRTLTGHVASRIPAVELARAFNSGKTADVFAAEIAAREPVGKALHSQKAEAVKAAAADAAVTVGYVQKKLEDAGWDRNAVVSYPSHYEHDHKAKRAEYHLFCGLSKADPALGYQSYTSKGRYIVVMNEEAIARFIQQAEEAAAIQYDAFICKMVSKVGPDVADAAIKGDHVWSYSILTVTLKDGTEQRWKTQQITNYSVHGTRFPQWPSRIVK